MSRYRFIEAEKAHHATATLCRVMKVSRAAFYVWARHQASARADADRALLERITQLHRESMSTYGAPRIHHDLRDLGVRVGRRRVARLMRSAGLSGWTRRKFRTPRARIEFAPLPDLVCRNWAPTGPDQLWVADMTYPRTWEGWVYLAVVMDCFSRRIVGWALSNDLGTHLVIEAAEMAVTHRNPQPGLVFHSDRGCQYLSMAFGSKLKKSGILQSVGRPATCWDNIVAESFWATFKKDLFYRRSWPRRCDLGPAVFHYIEVFYNRRRRHSTLGHISPAEYEDRYARVA